MGKQIEILTLDDVRQIIEPLIVTINNLINKINQFDMKKEFYRNSDLKEVFGFSDNTIIKYRNENKLPYTKIGEVYYYPVEEIKKILEQNSSYYKLSK
jgi:hypothetical protein